MAERDLEFTAGVTFNTGPLVAEMQRLTALMQQSGATLNLQGPIEAAGAAARRAVQDFKAVDLSLANISRSAQSVETQYIAQQTALKKVEASIRAISQLPITTQKQYDALLALEALQKRLSGFAVGGLDLNTPQKLAQAMAGATTQMARFEAELKGVAEAQRQVATISEAMRVALSSRIAVDPSYIATLTQLREAIGQVGPLGRAAFAELERGIAKFEGDLGRAVQMELKFSDALNMNQRDAMRVAAAYDTIGRSLQSQDRIAEAAGIRQERRLQEVIRLQARVAALPVTAASTAISGQLAGMQGPGQNPVQIAALRTQVLQLEIANNAAAASAKKLAAEIDGTGNAAKRNAANLSGFEKAIESLSSRIQRQTEFILAAGASYAAFNTLSAVVHHVVALDEAMHRISATIDDQETKARILPRSYALIQQGMTQFGQSTEDAGKLVLELTRSLGDLTQVNAAFLPALALTVRGEVNMADATKVLIGSVNAFGEGLIGVTDPLEAFGVAADKIIKASNLSVGSIGTFSVALTNLAGRASVSNTTFSETLAALSLVQDSLGRAGQSGTGLARVFEGLLLHANQLAEMFDIAFDPARAVNPIDLLTKTFAKLREEIRLTGGVSSETEAKIQKIIGTEQGTRIIELLIKDWEKFPARLKAITDSSGQHLRELKEHNEQLGVSFKNMMNGALVAVDTILNGLAKLGGGEGGAPGQFRSLAQMFNTLAAGFLQFGKDVETAAEKIKKIIDAIASLRPPPQWLSWLIGAPAGTPAASRLDQIAAGLDKISIAVGALPQGLPNWLNKLLFVGTAAVVATAVSGGTLTVPAALAAYLAFDATEYVLESEKAQKAAEKTTKAANEAARAMAAQGGHDPAAIGDQAAEAERNVELNRARMLRERLALLGELETKSKNEISQRSGELGIVQQIAAARSNAAKSERDYQDARAKYIDAQKLSDLGEKDTAAAGEKLAQLKKKSVTDQIELIALQKTYNDNQRKQAEELSKLETDRAEAITKLKDLLESFSTIDPLSQIFIKGQKAYDDLYKELEKKGLPGFGEKNKGLIQATVDAQMKQAGLKLYEGLVSPYRDATDTANDLIAKLIFDTEQAYARLGNQLSFDKRTELRATPDLAIDKQIGADKVAADLRAASAVLGQFGDDAAKAIFAASRGFNSFNDLIVEASLRLQYMGDTSLTRVIDRFILMRGAISSLNIDQLAREIEVTAKAIDTAFEMGTGFGLDPALIAANNEALKRTGLTIRELGVSADETHNKLAGMFLVNAQQTITKGNIENLQQQLISLTRANEGTVASFGQVGAAALATQLAFQLEGKSVDELSARMRQLVIDVAAATQKQKELGDTQGLIRIGVDPGRAASMAKQLATEQQEVNKQIEAGTQALTTWNQRAEVSYQRQLEIVKQTALDSKDYFSFLIASFEQAATAGHEFYQDLDTLAKNTANNMRSAFSDIFFATLQGNMKDAQAAFKNFFLSILREISNLMASQAVKGFMGLFGISASGGQLSFAGGGLGSLFGGGSAVGQPGGIGTSDITRPTGIGMNSAGFAVNEPGGDPFSAVKFAQAGNSVLSSAKSFAGAGSVFDAIKSGWAGSEGLFGGIAGAASEGFAAMDAAFTGLNAVVGYAAAVISGILIVMDENKSDLGKGIQTATLAAGIAAAPWTAGLSLIAAGVINWIEDLFGLFDKGISSYTQKRIDAGEQATRGVKTVAEGYERATTSGDPNAVLQALRAKSEGVGTILMATPELAARIGLNVQGYGPGQISEGRFEVSWDDVTTEQFNRLLAELAKDEGQIQGVVGGRAFVNYLPQEQVGQAQEQVSGIATGMLQAFVQFQKVRDELLKMNKDIQEVVKNILPPDLAEAFKRNLLDPIQQQIIDAVSSGMPIDKLTVKLNNLKATLGAYINLVDLYGSLTQDFASYSGDFVKTLAFVDEQTKKARVTASTRVSAAARDVGLGPDLVEEASGRLLDVGRAVQTVKQAFANLDLTPVQAFERLTELRTAVIERYELEKKLVLEAEAGIAKLYSEHVSGMIALQQSLSELETSISGSDASLNSLIQSLLQIGTTSLSVSEALYTVGAALDVFIKSLPARIAGKTGRPDDPNQGAGALPVDQILAATMGVVVPFAATLNREIRNAFDSGDFESAFHLVQQLGAGLKSAMEAAVAGVRQWEAATIAMINREADLRIRAADEVRKGIQANIDGQRQYVEGVLREIQRQKDAIEDQKFAIEDSIRGIRESMKPLEDQIKSISRAQEALRRSMRPTEQAIRGIGDLMRPIAAQLTALERQATALQRIADDQLWNIGLQTYALEQQRDTIQDNIDLISEMADAVEGVREYLKDLALSQQAPPDAIGQFQIAKGAFDELFQSFTAAPDAKGLEKLQEAAGDLFGTLEPLYARASNEYRALYEEIVRKLEAAGAQGADIGDPATLEDLEKQLKSVDGQLETLNDAADLINHNLELAQHAIELLQRPLEDRQQGLQDQIDALNLIKDGIQHQIDLLEDQKGPIQDQIDIMQGWIDGFDDQLAALSRQEALLSRQETTLNRDLARIADGQDWLNQAWQNYVDSINFQRDQAIDATETAADTIVLSIEQAMMPLMEAVGRDAHAFYEWMRDNQYARLLDLTNGAGTAAWMRTALQDTAAWINLIRIALDGFLSGDMRAVTAAVADKSTDERLISVLNRLDGTLNRLDANLAGQPNQPPVDPNNPPQYSVVQPGPDSPGGLAEGAWNVAPGTYNIHANEMVVPKAQAEMLRASADSWSSLGQLAQGGGGDTYVTIAPVVNSNQNPTLIVNQLVDRIVTDIRGGGAVQDAIARMPKRSR